MALPTKEEISDAIELGNSLNIPSLVDYESIQGLLGPESYAGGYCIVFPFSNGKDKKAVRVWHQEIDAIKERYGLLSKDLMKINSAYLCNIEYVENGLTVDLDTVDVVVLDWISGKSLKQHLQQILSDDKIDKESEIRKLAEGLKQMFVSFRQCNFSHGDLQHDNIIITDEGDIKVIDYDSSFTPSLGRGYFQTTTGYNGYQHPSRSTTCYVSNEKADYFSELILYLSLIAISNDLSLWKYAEDADYSLLFTADDFQKLKESPLYGVLFAQGEEMQLLLQILQEYLSVDDINLLEPFDVLLERYKKDPEIRSFTVEQSSGVYKGSKAKLCWEVENASKIILDGIEVNRDSRSALVDIPNTKDFLLEVINGQKSVKAVCRVTALVEPNISLKTSTSKVRKGVGEAVNIKWKVDNAVCVELIADGIVLSEKKSGELLVYPKETTNYKIIAVGLDRKMSFKKECKVVALSACEAVFGSNKDFSYPGLPIVLSWNVKHAKNVELVDFGKQSLKGSIVVEPQYDKVYELLVDDVFGRKSYRTTVRMLPLPLVKSLAVPCPDTKTKINVQLVTNLIDFKVSMPKLPEISISLPKVQIAPELQTTAIEKKIDVCSKTEPIKKDSHPIISKIRNYVQYNLIKLSIWKIKVLKNLRKNSND